MISLLHLQIILSAIHPVSWLISSFTTSEKQQYQRTTSRIIQTASVSDQDQGHFKG